MIKFGSINIVGVYKGSTPITSIYNGINKVFGASLLSEIVEFEVTTNSTYEEVKGFYLPNSGSKSIQVDWGDGKGYVTQSASSSGGLTSPEYRNKGTYKIKMKLTEDLASNGSLYVFRQLGYKIKLLNFGKYPTLLRINNNVSESTYINICTYR